MNTPSKLVYLFVFDFQSIKSQGFLFTSEYTVKEERTPDGFTIIFSDNEKHLYDFFPQNIEEITAIVGVNGSGKSSVLKFISNNLTGLPFQGLYLAVIKKGRSLIAECSNPKFNVYYNSRKLDLTISKNTDIISSNKILIDNECKSNILNDFEIIKYYNGLNYNILNSNQSQRIEFDNEFKRDNRTINISTNYLLYNDSTQSRSTDSKLERLDEFYYEELKRNLEFLKSQVFNFSDLIKPEVLAIRHNPNHKRFGSIGEFVGTPLTKLDRYIDELLLSPSRSESMPANDLFLIQIRRSILIELLNLEHEHYTIRREILKNLTELNSWNVENISIQLYEPIFELINRIISEKKRSIYISLDIKGVMGKINLLLDKLRELTINTTETQHPSKQELFINTNSKDFYLLLEILTLLRSLPDNFNRLIGFEWRNLSSGEQAFFNFISRLYSCYERITDSAKSNVLFLIDEGDLNYHPEWQRIFLSETLAYTQELFPQKNLQFIFTSNTPFIVADLPKDKVIHLNKDEIQTKDSEGNPIRQFRTVVNKDARPETFASNIHELLSENFYLSSTFGAFAIEKLNSVADELNKHENGKNRETNQTVSNTDVIRWRRFINIIGERVVQDRFKHLYYVATGELFDEDNIEELERQRSEIQKRIDQKKRP